MTSFSRMDSSTPEQWAEIGRQISANQGRVADGILALLESLADQTDGFAVDQLTHALQTATRAEEAGADTDVVVASLCHDIGKAISVFNHPAISAEIIKPYVRDEVYQMIRVHQDFQGKHYYNHFGAPTNLREQYAAEEWYSLAERFADDWDQTSFDPNYPTKPLSHFEGRVREVFGKARA